MTRRRFTTIVGLTALGLAAGAVGWKRRRLIEWLSRPGVAPAPVGPLEPATAATLLAATRALLGAPITEELYADYFDWRARNRPGYRALYAAFARHLDARARRAGAKDFAAADAESRRRILAAFMPTKRWVRMSEGLLHRGELLWRQQVLREIVRQFARTDGFLRLGYDTWPGRSLPFENALVPPPGAA